MPLEQNPHRIWISTEYHFSLAVYLRPTGAPISHFWAWMHNHFCVKLSSLSCNKQKKMQVESFFFLCVFLPRILLILVFLLVGISFGVWSHAFMHYITDLTLNDRNHRQQSLLLKHPHSFCCFFCRKDSKALSYSSYYW